VTGFDGTNNGFDPDAFRGPEVDLDALRKRPSRKLPHHRQGEKFLKGPIPWSWLSQACRLPGKALAIALLLWKEAFCRRNGTVRFRLEYAAGELAISRATARRGLRALAAVRLVSVRYLPGRALEVTINEAPAGVGLMEGDRKNGGRGVDTGCTF
jgi:hypothetical protein